MLKTLDVLIGFSLVMLIMSMAVTMLTQMIGSAMLNLRGNMLKVGLARLLALLDHGLTPTEAKQVADHILRNPLIAQPTWRGRGHRLAPVVHREEFVKLILDFAVAGDADRASDDEATKALRKTIKESLRRNGINDPKTVLKDIRKAMMELERTSPELSHCMRLNLAILRFAASEFLGKVNGWFDQTIDRVSDLFTARTRLVTALVAIFVAFFLHLDAIALLNRLSVDSALREQLVAAAIQRADQPPPGNQAASPPAARGGSGTPSTTTAPAAPGSQGGGATPAPAQDIQGTLTVIREAGTDDLERFGLISFPRSFDAWKASWYVTVDTNGDEPGGTEVQASILMGIVGILLTAALLSLGAPFWYSMMRDLLRLRSMIARKDDDERTERQTSQAPAIATAAVVPPAFRGGEAGDLESAG